MKSRYLLISAVLMFWSSIAIAGYIQPAPIVVDLDNMHAQGDMWTARESNNDVEFIGCGFRQFSDSQGFNFEFGFCQASDADGNSITCFTEDPVLVERIAGTSDFSFVTFGWVNEPGTLDGATCTRVGFSTQSFYLPKFKVQKGMGDDD